VTLLERSPEVHALLADGIARASRAGPEFAAIVARMTLRFGDARQLLPGLGADVVLVDPMHPPRGNTALVKKEMRLLRELVGTDPDALELVQAALAAAHKRVVLKWPLRAPPLAGLRQPSHQIVGKTTRYDVFMTAVRTRSIDAETTVVSRGATSALE
jgi:16S rRNA (guanine1516-N2)-methyltransferase